MFANQTHHHNNLLPRTPPKMETTSFNGRFHQVNWILAKPSLNIQPPSWSSGKHLCFCTKHGTILAKQNEPLGQGQTKPRDTTHVLRAIRKCHAFIHPIMLHSTRPLVWKVIQPGSPAHSDKARKLGGVSRIKTRFKEWEACDSNRPLRKQWELIQPRVFP